MGGLYNMGQYHKVYNIDKKVMINAHGINNGLKLVEQIGHDHSTSTALFLLLANSNGRGGGDVEDHYLIGSWAGDRIVIQGDYAEESDQGYIKDVEDYRDISAFVNELLNITMGVTA
jgi:hypothetical protein